MFIFSHFFGLHEKTRRVFFKIIALLLSVVFVLPGMTWAFDWRNLKREHKNAYLDFEIKKNLARIISLFTPQDETPALSVVHVEDLHTNYEAQDHIQQLIAQFVAQNQIRLVAVEGSVGFLDANRLRRLPYPDLKKQLFRHFMQNGQLSGTEAAALVSDESVVLYGVEDADAYERSLAIVRKFLGSKVQTQFQLVRYLLEELIGAVNTEELAELDDTFEALQEQKLSLSAYLTFLKKRASSLQVSLADYPELAELETRADWEAHEVDLKTRRLRQAVRAKLYSRPAQQAAIDRWREDLDRMERLLNIAAFPDDVTYAREQGLRFSLKAFLDFYKDVAPSLGVSAEVEPKLYAMDARLQEAMEFYTLAEQRNRTLVANTVQAMHTYKVPRAVLVAGGYHTQGIDAELDARKVSRVTVRPTIRSWQDNAHYYRQLSGEVGPFRSLFMPPEKHLLALSSVLEQRSEQQDFWQAFGALYVSQAIALLQKEGLTAADLRTRMDAILMELNQGSPYAVRVDWEAWPGAVNTGAVPLILEAEGRSTRVLAVAGEWKNAAVAPFYTVKQGSERLALYHVAFTPGMAASLRAATTPRWQQSLARAGLGVRAWFMGESMRAWTSTRREAQGAQAGFVSVAVLTGLALGVVVTGLTVGTLGWFPGLALGLAAIVGVPWLLQQWTARKALLATVAPGWFRGTVGEAWDAQWEARVEELWKQEALTPTDVARITLHVAGHPQALARWQPWLTRLADATQHSNAAVQAMAQAVLNQYTAREVASVSGSVGTSTLRIALGETPQQKAEAVLHMYTQAVLATSQSPLAAGQTPESRLAAAQTALGWVVDTWVREGWWTPNTQAGLDVAWQSTVRRLDEAMQQAFQADRRAGWGQALAALNFQTLHEIGSFRQGVSGWVATRRQERAQSTPARTTGSMVREQAWTTAQRTQWLGQVESLIRNPQATTKVWDAQWKKLDSTDIETRLQLLHALLKQQPLFGIRHRRDFNLDLVDLRKRAEELDHDVLNLSWYALGFVQVVARDFAKQVEGRTELEALAKTLRDRSGELMGQLKNIHELSEFLKHTEAEIAEARAKSTEGTVQLKALTVANIGLMLNTAAQKSEGVDALAQGVVQSPEQWHTFGQTLLLQRVLEIREQISTVLSLLDLAMQQNGRNGVKLNLTLARKAYLYTHLLKDAFDYPTFMENVDVRQTMDLKFVYALMQEEPELFSRGAALGDNDLEVSTEASFFDRTERVWGDYGQAVLSVVANLVVNAQKELDEKRARMGAAGDAFRGKIKVTFGPNRIRVEDNGRGIPEEALATLTERGITSRPEQGGRGIGLYMVQETVREFGGTLRISNRAGPETGAAFEVVFHTPSWSTFRISSPRLETIIKDMASDARVRAELLKAQSVWRLALSQARAWLRGNPWAFPVALLLGARVADALLNTQTFTSTTSTLMLGMMLPLSPKGETQDEAGTERPNASSALERIDVPLVEHPSDSYWREASQNLGMVLNALQVPQQSVVLNVGSGRNPLLAQGYRVINIDESPGLDVHARDGQEVYIKGFFGEDFSLELKRDAKLVQLPSVMVFFNMWTFMGLYGPLQFGDPLDRMHLNARLYLGRAWEMLPEGGRLIFLQHMPPESGGSDVYTSLESVPVVEALAQRNPNAQVTRIYRTLNGRSVLAGVAVEKTPASVPVNSTPLTRGGAMIFSSLGLAASLLGTVGLSLNLGHDLGLGSMVNGLSMLGAVGGLGMVLNYTPRLLYALNLLRPRTPALTVETLTAHVTPLLEDLERRGDLPMGYRRPSLQVLPEQSWVSMIARGLQIGYGQNGVVSLHRHFDALPAEAQRAILRHEVFEAFGEGHWRATWEEYKTLLGGKTQKMPAGFSKLAERVRAVPTEEWLGEELVRSLQQLHPTAGDVRTWPRLDFDDPNRIASAAFYAIQKGLPENQLVVARMLQYVPEEKALRVLIFVDTLKHLWKMIPTNFTYASEFMQTQATVGVWLYPETRLVNFAAVVLSPELRGRGTGLGNRFMQQIGRSLNRLWPGAPVVARAIHPVSAFGIEQWFAGKVDWQHPNESAAAKERAFRALGIIAPETYVGANLINLVQALKIAKEKAGASRQSDIDFLLTRIRNLAQEFLARPETLQAWLARTRGELNSYSDEKEWLKITDERSMVKRIFEVTVNQLYLQGRLGVEPQVREAVQPVVNDENSPGLEPEMLRAGDWQNAGTVMDAWQGLKTLVGTLPDGVPGLRLDALERATGYAVRQATQAPTEQNLTSLRAAWELGHLTPESVVRSWPEKVQQAVRAWESAVQGVVPELSGYVWDATQAGPTFSNRGGNLRVSPLRTLGVTLGALGVGAWLSFFLSPAAALTTVSIWGAVSGMALVGVMLPRMLYLLQLIRPRAPALEPSTAQSQVERVFASLEQRGLVPNGYVRPRIHVLPKQSWISSLLRGVVIGNGNKGVVSLHRNFLSLTPQVQSVVLRHEIFEALGYGHVRATWEELRLLVAPALGVRTREEQVATRLRALPLSQWIGEGLDQALRLKNVENGLDADPIPVISITQGYGVPSQMYRLMERGLEPGRLVAVRMVQRDSASSRIRFSIVVDTADRIGLHFSTVSGTLYGKAMQSAPVVLDLELTPGSGKNGEVHISGLGVGSAWRGQGRGLGAALIRQARESLQTLMPNAVVDADAVHPVSASVIAEQFNADLAWWTMPASWGRDWVQAFRVLGIPLTGVPTNPTMLELRDALQRFKYAQGVDGLRDIDVLLQRIRQLAEEMHAQPALLDAWLAAHRADLRSEADLTAWRAAAQDVRLFTQKLFEATLLNPRMEGSVSTPLVRERLQVPRLPGLQSAQELSQGIQGRAFSARLTPEEMAAPEEIEGLLNSPFSPDVTRAILSMEYHAAELGPKLSVWVPRLIDYMQRGTVHQDRVARQTLDVIKVYLSGELRTQVETEIAQRDTLNRLWLVTRAGRLANLHQFLYAHPGLRELLQRPGGVVINDIGLGGPEPVTTAELAQWVTLMNPENQVVGADILIPAFRSTDRQSQVFAYHNAQGEIIDVYSKNGNPLPSAAAKYYREQFAAALINFKEGRPTGPQVEVEAEPIGRFAQANGFSIRLASYGEGIKASLKVCFNVLYMNPGRETSILTRMAEDLEPGGYLINGLASPAGRDEAALTFALYRKGQDGVLRPQGMYFMDNGLQYYFPLKPEYQTIVNAENFAREEVQYQNNRVILDPLILSRYGMTLDDVVITPLAQVSKNTVRKERSKLSKARNGANRMDRELRVAPLRILGMALAALGVGGVLSLTLAPVAALTTLSLWGAFSGLALVGTYAPRLWYLLQIIQPRAPALTSATVNQQLAELIADLERRGGLPENYRRPQLDVLPTQSFVSSLWQGLLLGDGRDGLVRVHANFLSLSPAVQRAILLHEMYEAHTRGHARATLRELRSLFTSAAQALWRSIHPQAISAWWSLPFAIFAFEWTTLQSQSSDALSSLPTISDNNQTPVRDTELAAGAQGLVAEIAAQRANTVDIDALGDLLLSQDPQDNVRGMVSLEAHWTELDEYTQKQGLSFLISENDNADPYLARAAWQALKGIKPYLQDRELYRAEETLRRYQANNQLVLMTHPGRLNSAYRFLLQHPIVGALLRRPGGAVVNDIGLGGPDPVTTAELTRMITEANPENRVVGADILVPAFRVSEPATGTFTYLNAQGEIIGVYKQDGQPLGLSGYESLVLNAYRAFKAGQTAEGFEVLANPLQTYAQQHGFTVQESSYGRGIKADIKIVFNVLYMNAGKETEIITRMGEDLPVGGIVVSGLAFVMQGKPYTSFVIYQKQGDGSMRALSVNKIYDTTVSVFPLKPGHQSIAEAERANQVLRINYDGRPNYNLELLEPFGLFPDDIEVAQLSPVAAPASDSLVRLRVSADRTPVGNLRVSPLRSFGSLLMGLGAGAVFSLWASPDAVLTFSASWGLGWLALALPRWLYVRALSRPSAPTLVPATAQTQVASVFEHLEREGGLPSGYVRPRVDVLPQRYTRLGWVRGLLVGQGVNGVVRLHRSFLSLSPSAQRAVLRHEIFEAFGQGHLRATWAEAVSYLRAAWRGLGHTWDAILRALVSIPFRFIEREGLIPVVLLSVYAWLTGQTYQAEEDVYQDIPAVQADRQVNYQEAELQPGLRGEVAQIPVRELRAVPLEGIPFKLYSKSVADNVQAMVSIELRAAEMSPEQLAQSARDLMRLNTYKSTRIGRTAWQTLNAIKDRLTPELKAQAEANLAANQKNSRLILTTSPQRLTAVHAFMLMHSGIRDLLKRKGGVVINDIGLGGPMPYTTAELTTMMKQVNPENTVVGADILLPAFRTWDGKTGLFAYHNAQGEIIGIYGKDGRPLSAEDEAPYRARFEQQWQKHQSGQALEADMEVTADPIQTFAREKGFEVKLASYGNGIRAGIKLCFNVLYMNPGRETEIITRMGEDLEPGGYLLNGIAATAEQAPFTVFSLYQKQLDGTLLPLSVHMIMEGLTYEFPMKPGYQSIERVESLAMEEYHMYSGQLLLEERQLSKYGLSLQDVKVSRAIRNNRGFFTGGWVTTTLGKEQALRVSPWRALGATGVAVGLGAVLGMVVSPSAAVTTVSLWGAFSGLGLILNFVPRLYYALRLLRPRAPALQNHTVNQQLLGLLEDIERRGGLPENYERPELQVLPKASVGTLLGRGLLIGQGRLGVVSLHANFLSLPLAVQRAVLVHEIYEALGKGHVRASWQELLSYINPSRSVRNPVQAPASPERLQNNPWMNVFYQRTGPEFAAKERGSVEQFLRPDHPLKVEVFRAIDALTEAEILRRAERYLAQDGSVSNELVMGKDAKRTLDGTPLSLRTLFISPTTGRTDLRQVLFTNLGMGFVGMLNILLKTPRAARTRELIAAHYVLLRALEILSRNTQVPLVQAADVDEMAAYLTTPVVQQYVLEPVLRNWLGLSELMLPADTPAKREGLKNVLALVERLKTSGPLWQQELAKPENQALLQRVQAGEQLVVRREALLDNPWLRVFYIRGNKDASWDRKNIERLLALDHPLKAELFAEVDRWSEAEVLERVTQWLNAESGMDQYGFKQHAFSPRLQRVLGVRELFLHPTSGELDLRQVLFTGMSYGYEDNLSIAMGTPLEATARNVLLSHYALLRAVDILSRDTRTPLVQTSDIAELTAYLQEPRIMQHGLGSLGVDLANVAALFTPADTPSKRESLRNLLTVFDQLAQRSEVWRAALSQGELHTTIQALRAQKHRLWGKPNRNGALRWSGVSALGTAIVGVGVGLGLAQGLSPEAALTGVSVWSAVGGLAWILNYVPRAYYAFRLLTGKAPLLSAETADGLVRGIITEVEREGGLPAGYVRPVVEVLPAQGWVSQLWKGLVLGQGTRRADGTPVVRLHARFLSLPFAVRVAVLRHELFESQGQGHLRASWEEFRTYFLAKRLHEGLPQVQRSELQNIDTFRENNDKALAEVTYQGERYILSERVADVGAMRFDPLTPERIVELVNYYAVLDSVRYAGERVAPQAVAVVREGGQIVGYLMEKIPGATLAELVDDGVLTREQIQDALRQVQEQLTLLHGLGYGHGDLHAQNILVELSHGRLRARLFDYQPGWGASVEKYDLERWAEMNSEIWVGFQNRKDANSQARLLAQADAIDDAIAGRDVEAAQGEARAAAFERETAVRPSTRTSLPHLILRYQTEPGVLPKDVTRIREAQDRGSLLNEAVFAILGTERNRLVQIGPDVKLKLLGRGAFKSAYRAEILVRFENGESRWLAVAVKVPRSVLGTLISFEGRNWARLQGHPNVVSFVRQWQGVLAEAFVDALPSTEAAAQPRRVAATYLSLLAHLWNRQGEHWFFYDPKAENIMFPKNTAEAPKVVDLDGVAPTPVKFSPFTVLTYLTAYHGASALWLTRVLNGLAAPIMLFTSAFFAYFAKPQRAVFDAFLDAFGVENGRRYLEGAQRGWVHALASRSALARALDEYLSTGIRTYQTAAAPATTASASQTATRPTLESLTAQLNTLSLREWVGPEAERALQAMNQDARSVDQWPVLEVTPYQDITQVVEHARAQGVQNNQLVALKVVYPEFKRQGVRVMLLIDRLDHFDLGGARAQTRVGELLEFGQMPQRAWSLDDASVLERAQFVVSVDLKPNLGSAGEVHLDACSLSRAYQKKGLGREMRLRIRDILSSVLPGAAVRGYAIHPASVTTILQSFGADIDWEHPDMEASLEPMTQALVALEILPAKSAPASVDQLATAVLNARQQDGMASFNDAVYVMYKLQEMSARFQENRAYYSQWARTHKLTDNDLPRELAASRADLHEWNVFMYKKLFGGMLLAGRVPVVGEDSEAGLLGPVVEWLHPAAVSKASAPVSQRLEQTASRLRALPLASWLREDLVQALMEKNHETQGVDEWPVLDVRLDQDLTQVFAQARARGIKPQQVIALRVVEMIPQQGAVRTALLVDSIEGFMARWKGLLGEALDTGERAHPWTIASTSALERAQVTVLMSIAPEKNQAGEVYLDVFALDGDLQQRGLGQALTEGIQSVLTQIVPGARLTALTVHPAATRILSRTFGGDIAWNDREAKETNLLLGPALTGLDLAAPNAFRRTVPDIHHAFEQAKEEAGAQAQKDIEFLFAKLSALARRLSADPAQYVLWALQHGVQRIYLPEALRRAGVDEREWITFLFRVLVHEVYVQGRVPFSATESKMLTQASNQQALAIAAQNTARTARLRSLEASLKALPLTEWLGADLMQALNQVHPASAVTALPVLEVTAKQDLTPVLEKARQSGLGKDQLVALRVVQSSRRLPTLQAILLVDTLEHFAALGERAQRARPKKLLEDDMGQAWWLDGLPLLNQAEVVLQLNLDLTKDLTGDVYLDSISLSPQLQGRGLGRGMLDKLRTILTEAMPGARFETFAVHPVIASTVVRDYSAELDWDDRRPAQEERAQLEKVWARLGLDIPEQVTTLAGVRQKVLAAKQQAGRTELRDAEYLLLRFEEMVAQMQGRPEVLRAWALKHNLDLSGLSPEQRQAQGDAKSLARALYDLAILTLHLRGRVPEKSGSDAARPVTPVRPMSDAPVVSERMSVQENQGRLELRTTDPTWLQAWEFFQTEAAAPVIQVLGEHLKQGGTLDFSRTPGNTLLLRQGQTWTLDGRLLTGQNVPGQPRLGPAPLVVWEALLGQPTWTFGGRAWSMSAVFDNLAERYGVDTLARSEAWVRLAAMPTAFERWQARVGISGVWDALTGRGGSVHASELAEWLRVNLLRPLSPVAVSHLAETTVPKGVVDAVRAQVQTHVRAFWSARQAVVLWSAMSPAQRAQGLTVYADQAELLAAIKTAVQTLAEQGEAQAQALLPKLNTSLLSEKTGAVAPTETGLVLVTQVQMQTPVTESLVWAKLVKQGRVYVFGRPSNEATDVFRAQHTLNWTAWQSAMSRLGSTAVGQESEWLQAGLAEVAIAEDQLSLAVENAVANQPLIQKSLRSSVLGARSSAEQQALLRDTAAQMFDETAYDGTQQVMVTAVGSELPVARRQAVEVSPWQTTAKTQSSTRLVEWAGGGTRLTLEPASRLTAKAPSLRHRLFLATVASIFMTRKVTLLQTAFGRSSEVRGNRLWAIVRHSQFAQVLRNVWGIINGRFTVRGEVDAQTAEATANSLKRNVIFNLLFGRSPWVQALRGETAALQQASERLGTIGLELAPDAYLKYQLDRQLLESGVGERERALVLRNLWENSSWTRNLVRLQALSREADRLSSVRQNLRLARLERRLLAALLSELQQPGADAVYQVAVVKALAVFTPEQQVRVRMAVPEGRTVVYSAFWIPDMVLRQPQLRNQLVTLFPVYDDAGVEVKPADPSVIRSLAGSA